MVPLSESEPSALLTSTRLRLPLISADDAAGMLAGKRRVSWHTDYPRREDADAASLVKEPLSGWGPRHLVRSHDGVTLGSAGFQGPPQPAPDEVPEVEVALGLVTEARGHGAGREALETLLAEADRLGVRVRAGVSPANTAAMRLLARSGFTELRGSREGDELVMVRPRPESPTELP